MTETAHIDDKGAVDPRVDLAVLRTELAWERTVLAWIRTVIGLMTAGVAFDKGVQLLHQERVLAGTALVRNGHVAGLSLTGISTALLMIVTVQYMRGLHALAGVKSMPSSRMRPAIIASVLVILLGIAVLVVLAMSNG